MSCGHGFTLLLAWLLGAAVITVVFGSPNRRCRDRGARLIALLLIGALVLMSYELGRV